MDEKIIHLFILNDCTHHCKMCCNKQYSIDEIPVVTVEELKKAETVLLTGGEPFLLDSVCNLAQRIKQQYSNVNTIYVYTCGDSLLHYLRRGNKLHHIDGVNISPKTKYDAKCVNEIFDTEIYRRQIVSLWSNRIYLFPEIKKYVYTHHMNYDCIAIMNREWQEKFVANSGIFRRLPVLY